MYVKSVIVCFGTVVMMWIFFEWSTEAFTWLSLGCLVAPLVYQELAVKLAHTQSAEERHECLHLELLSGVAYKPQTRRQLAVELNSGNLIRLDRRRRESHL